MKASIWTVGGWKRLSNETSISATRQYIRLDSASRGRKDKQPGTKSVVGLLATIIRVTLEWFYFDVAFQWKYYVDRLQSYNCDGRRYPCHVEKHCNSPRGGREGGREGGNALFFILVSIGRRTSKWCECVGGGCLETVRLTIMFHSSQSKKQWFSL